MRFELVLGQVVANIRGLGARRLITLGAIVVLVTSLIGGIGYYYSKPSMEALYSGLARDDVVSIGAALKEAGIQFDVNADGTVIFTPVGQAPMARMTLAEKGLPHGGNIGNELFDKLGSLGLTSFMQDVTRTRAVEGELARTIMRMRGVKAARVHIVMGDAGSFRRERQSPSASVVVRLESGDGVGAGQAIRRLVSSAVAGMAMANVTVLSADGAILVSGEEYSEQGAGTMLSLEKEVSRRLRDNVSQTLAPYLKARNYQVSVAVRLNTDRRQTSETIYNPESRVERSVRVVKENQTSQNSTTQPPTSVQSNLPQSRPTASDAKQANDETQKRDETTNFEVSSKQTNTTSAGYAVETLSVVVLVNRAALPSGADTSARNGDETRRISEIEDIAASAAGARRDKGDVVKVAVVDFGDPIADINDPLPQNLIDILARQAGSLAGAAAVVLATIIIVLFAIKPALSVLAKGPDAREWREAEVKAITDGSVGPIQDGALNVADRALESEAKTRELDPSAGGASMEWREIANVIESFLEQDEGRAAGVIKAWLATETAS